VANFKHNAIVTYTLHADKSRLSVRGMAFAGSARSGRDPRSPAKKTKGRPLLGRPVSFTQDRIYSICVHALQIAASKSVAATWLGCSSSPHGTG
jgi:hypothetical protein